MTHSQLTLSVSEKFWDTCQQKDGLLKLKLIQVKSDYALCVMSNPSHGGLPVTVLPKAPTLAHTHLEKAHLPLEELVMFRYQTRRERSIIPALNIQMLSSCHLHPSPFLIVRSIKP